MTHPCSARELRLHGLESWYSIDIKLVIPWCISPSCLLAVHWCVTYIRSFHIALLMGQIFVAAHVNQIMHTFTSLLATMKRKGDRHNKSSPSSTGPTAVASSHGAHEPEATALSKTTSISDVVFDPQLYSTLLKTTSGKGFDARTAPKTPSKQMS